MQQRTYVSGGYTISEVMKNRVLPSGCVLMIWEITAMASDSSWDNPLKKNFLNA